MEITSPPLDRARSISSVNDRFGLLCSLVSLQYDMCVGGMARKKEKAWRVGSTLGCMCALVTTQRGCSRVLRWRTRDSRQFFIIHCDDRRNMNAKILAQASARDDAHNKKISVTQERCQANGSSKTNTYKETMYK